MLSIKRAQRLARWVWRFARRDHVPDWVLWGVWSRLERACPSAEEPLLRLLWETTWEAPARRRARMVAALARNPHELSAPSLGLAWRRWLAEPDDALWEMLRDRAQPTDNSFAAGHSRLALGLAQPEELCAAAIDLDGPEHLRAMLVERCIAQGLAPADPRQRVVFLLLTGQMRQYRAADPDGSLLTAAYQAASGRLRGRLRAAMVGTGDLDLVRVVAGGDRTRVVGMHPEERGYLVGQLVARRDWPALWRLLPQLPLVDAAAAARRFRDGWRPGDDRGRALFARLSAATPEWLAAGLAELTPARMVRVAPGGQVEDCALSPDGTRLAVAFSWVRNGQRSQSVVDYELPSRRLVARYEKTGTAPDYDYGSFWHLLHTGDAVIAAFDRNLGFSPLIRYADGDRQILNRGEEWGGEVGALAHTRGGFAALTLHDTLLLGGADGRTGLRQVRLPDLTGHDWLWHRALAGERDAGLLAVCGKELLVIDQDATRLIARGTIPGDRRPRHVQFTGPDQLIAGDDTRLSRWSLDGDRLVRETTAQFLSVDGVTALPRHHRVVARTRVPNNVGKSRWKVGPTFLDATTLRESTPPVIVTGDRKSVARSWSTPTGDHLAVEVTRNTVEVHGRYPHPAALLLERPPADLAPPDLATVTHAATGLPPGAARESLELLQTCLEYRFATEVALGGQDRVDRGDHDIALG